MESGNKFVSEEFQTFLHLNKIERLCSASYHLSTNGLPERFKQTMKQYLRAAKSHGIQRNLDCFLFSYHSSPHSTTKEPPISVIYRKTPPYQIVSISPLSAQCRGSLYCQPKALYLSLRTSWGVLT